MISNVCIFSAQYLPHLGGVEQYTYNIAKELINRGTNVTIVTNNTTSSPVLEEQEGMTIYRLSCFALLDGRFPIPKRNKIFKEVYQYLNNQHFDLIIINARFYVHSILAARFAKKQGIPSLCIEHGTSHLAVHNKILDFVGGWYEHIHTQILKCYCKDFYGVSKACCQWLSHFNIRSRGVLYNAVNLEKIETLKRNVEFNFRKIYGIEQHELVVVFTGRLLKEKGIYELISAVEHLNHLEKQKIHLMIAGDGEESEYVNLHRSRYIHPLGRIAFEAIIALLEQSDIFCLPSFSEGFSTAALEAAACRCYIISTKRGGTKELVRDEDYGIIMDDNDWEKIYTALKGITLDEFRRNKACELCYEFLKEKFTWTKTVDTLIEEVEKLN